MRKKRSKKSVYKRVKRADFLSDVKGRLERDVRPYLGCIHQIYASTGKGVGFWGIARMILPVIEAVANVIYRKVTGQSKPMRLLKRLGIEFPYLFWEMYRHPLIHTDQLRTATYRGVKVNWEIRVGGGHEFKSKHIAVDMEKLYKDFARFIDNEISTSMNKTVFVESGIKFGNGIKKNLKDEFRRILKP